MIRDVFQRAWHSSLRDIWRRDVKSKSLLVIFACYLFLSIPTVPLGAWVGYYLVVYFQRHSHQALREVTLHPRMYQPLDAAFTSDPRVSDKIILVRDSLLGAKEEFSEHIPFGFDSISVRPYYNFSSRKGIVLIDYFLSCGCDATAGKMRLFEIAMNTENLDYQVVNNVNVPWDYYLNPWIEFRRPLESGISAER